MNTINQLLMITIFLLIMWRVYQSYTLIKLLHKIEEMDVEKWIYYIYSYTIPTGIYGTLYCLFDLFYPINYKWFLIINGITIYLLLRNRKLRFMKKFEEVARLDETINT